jgi:hypothetical protein
MATTQKTRTTPQRTTGDFGQLAYGSSGRWEIAVDEALSGADRWWAQIEGPLVSIYFAIPSLEIIDKVSSFFASHATETKHPSNGRPKRTDSFTIGMGKRTPVTLMEDDEYDDRLFLVVGPAEGPMVRFVVVDTDLAQLSEALQQVKEDLDEQG